MSGNQAGIPDVILETLLDSARSAAALAYRAKHAGDVTNANRLFAGSALRFLSIAVTEYTHPDRALEFAAQEALPGLLAAGAQTTEELILAVRTGKAPRTALTGRYVLLALSHFATLVSIHESAITFCRLAEAREVSGTPFWDAYTDCYAKFMSRSDFDAPTLSLRGAERYWLPYLELMKAIVRHEDVETRVEDLRALFRKRNNDTRFVVADAHQIEGTCTRQAKWDFRLESLLILGTSANT